MHQNFLSLLKIYGKRREFFAFWAVVVFGAILLILALLSAPPLLIVPLVGMLAGVIAAAFSLALRLIEARATEEFHRRQFTTLLGGLRDGALVYDPNFTILSLNAAAENVTGVSATEIVGTRVDPAFVKNPHFRVLAQIIFPSLAPSLVQISEGSVWPQVVSISLEDPPLDLVATLHRITNVRGDLLGFLKIIHDRTHEQSIFQAKNEFISVAAHQLRTPLTAMNWAAQNLADMGEKLSPEATNLLKQIRELADRALRVTNDLLDASKIEEGRFGYTFEETDLAAFAAKVAGEAAVLAKEYGVAVVFQPPGDAGPFTVSMDPARIGTVLTNFLDNAIRYNTENGKVTVSISPVQGEPYLRVAVQDTGIGIPKEEAGGLFQKLQRGSNAARVEPNGTGLGLYIAKNIVKRHGGTVGFDSIEGRGSTFWFTLPTDPSLIPPREVAATSIE